MYECTAGAQAGIGRSLDPTQFSLILHDAILNPKPLNPKPLNPKPQTPKP